MDTLNQEPNGKLVIEFVAPRSSEFQISVENITPLQMFVIAGFLYEEGRVALAEQRKMAKIQVPQFGVVKSD